MNLEEKDRITNICQDFAEGFDFPIEYSGWLIVDPLSAYLSAVEGIENTIKEIPATDTTPEILVLCFNDGSRLVPAGSALNGRIFIVRWKPF